MTSPAAARTLLLLCLLTMAATVCPAADTPAQPFRQLYAGAEATGPNVVALWQFLPGQELKDMSGHGHDLALRGQARFTKDGPFGAALESFGAGEKNDKPQGAMAKDAADLSPAGAFTLEAWFCAKPEMADFDNVFLIDKKYITYERPGPQANSDYCLCLQRAGENRRRLTVSLGYGTDSAFVTGPDLSVAPGQWQHVAFTYDGAGRCRFFINGELAQKVVLEGRGPVSPGPHGVVIGDRFGSIYTGFPGYLAQVRIANGLVPAFTGGLTVGVTRGRTAFVRMEKNAGVTVNLCNDSPAPLAGVQARVSFGGATKTVAVPDLGPNAEHNITVPVDTTVRPGTYPLKLNVSAASGAGRMQVDKELEVAVVGRSLPNQMPVVMWGTGDIPRLKQLGFTHHLVGLVDEAKVWAAGKPVEAFGADGIAKQGEMLDNLLKAGLRAMVVTHPGTWITRDKERKAQYNRVDRAGVEREKDNVCGNFPRVQQYCYDIGASIMQTFGQYPALAGALVHSEVRDASDLCFHEHDKQAFRQFAGYDIPAEALSKGGLHYSRVRDFPANRVVKDDDHLLTFYRWFWREGDGWNGLHSEVDRGLKSTGRRDFWTFFDPAVRCPDIWGSGGKVDVISQWTYSYPDPIKIGEATDELFAMAEGRRGQQVMKMTQIIWYRTQTAPTLPEEESKRAQWEKDIPTADFLTIAPDHMREAFWSKLSRPIRGIMYHGWQSIAEMHTTKGYCFTNHDTPGVLSELTRDVVRPLGPTLLQVPDRPCDVAMLESAASQVFAGRGTAGWSGSWEADMHLMLQWAHLQPRIVFDETVLRDGLGPYRVLVMPYCDVLTERVAREIRAFQKRGGIIIADEFLCPAIVPDIVVPTYKRTGKADEDKAALQEKAAALRAELDPFYTRYGDCDSPDIVLRFRQYYGSDYLFALNDKRTYGDYVGHHGRVMEKGLPNAGTIAVRRKSGFLYDLVAHKAVATKAVNGALQFPASFGPGGGHLYLITARPISSLKLTAPAKAKRGGNLDLTVAVRDKAGEDIEAVVPIQIQVTDPQGNPAEFSGYYGASSGREGIRLNLARNDTPGTWLVKVTELASGLSKQQKVTVM